jgi:hypothetical protein
MVTVLPSTIQIQVGDELRCQTFEIHFELPQLSMLYSLDLMGDFLSVNPINHLSPNTTSVSYDTILLQDPPLEIPLHSRNSALTHQPKVLIVSACPGKVLYGIIGLYPENQSTLVWIYHINSHTSTSHCSLLAKGRSGCYDHIPTYPFLATFNPSGTPACAKYIALFFTMWFPSSVKS